MIQIDFWFSPYFDNLIKFSPKKSMDESNQDLGQNQVKAIPRYEKLDMNDHAPSDNEIGANSKFQYFQK